jgi:hypothetical protein
MQRYEGKPLRRLLECYVLSAIDKLDEEQCEALRGIESKLALTYNRSGTWREIIHDEMGFPDSLPIKIREVWEDNLARIRDNGGEIDPNEFAMAFVDQNFPEVFD